MKNNVKVENRQSVKYVLLLTLLFACLVAVLACLGKYIGDYLAYKNSWQAHASFEFEKLEDEVDENGNTVACYGVSTPAQLIGAIMLSSMGSESKKSEQYSGIDTNSTSPQLMVGWQDFFDWNDRFTGIYRLTQDIDFNDFDEHSWYVTDFGVQGNPNTVLDGGGHSIKNLKVIDNANAGFVNKNYGTIKNLNFENITFENTIRGSSSGVCLRNYNTIYACNILSGTITNYDQTSGFALFNETTGIIQECNNYANVTSNKDSVGGIARTNYGIINDCNNFGKLTAASSCGGIVATSYGNVVDCNNYGDIEGCGSIGGIAGSVYDLYCELSSLNVKNCINSGKISNNAEYSNCLAGGIVGQISTGDNKNIKIENCASFGDVNAYTPKNSDMYAGGIVGAIMGNNTSCNVLIEKCYNSAAILAENETYYAWANERAGGIVGFLSDGSLKINNCYNTGKIYSNNMNNAPYGGAVLSDSNYRVTEIKVGYGNGAIVVSQDLNRYIQKVQLEKLSNLLFQVYYVNDGYSGGLVGYTIRGFECNNCYTTGCFDFLSHGKSPTIKFKTSDKYTIYGSTTATTSGDYNVSFVVNTTYSLYTKPKHYNVIYGGVDSKSNVAPTLNNVYSQSFDETMAEGIEKIVMDVEITEISGNVIRMNDYENGKEIVFQVGDQTSGDTVDIILQLRYDGSYFSVLEDSLMVNVYYDLFGGLSEPLYRFGSKDGQLGLNTQINFSKSEYLGAKNSGVTERKPTAEDLGADLWICDPKINDGWPILKDFYWIYA